MTEAYDDLTAPIEDEVQLNDETPLIMTATEVAARQAELKMAKLKENYTRLLVDVSDRPFLSPDDHEKEVRSLEFRWGRRDGYEYRANLLAAEFTAHRVLLVKREILDKMQEAVGYAELSIFFLNIATALGVGFRTNPAFEIR